METTTLNGQIKDERVKKYYDALLKIHEILSYTSNVSVSSIGRKLSVSNHSIAVLLEGGILKKEGSHKRQKLFWNTIEPNLKMAETWVEKTRKKEAQANKESYLKKQKTTDKSKSISSLLEIKEQKEIIKYEGKIGPFKFTLKPIYK